MIQLSIIDKRHSLIKLTNGILSSSSLLESTVVLLRFDGDASDFGSCLIMPGAASFLIVTLFVSVFTFVLVLAVVVVVFVVVVVVGGGGGIVLDSLFGVDVFGESVLVVDAGLLSILIVIGVFVDCPLTAVVAITFLAWKSKTKKP
jgi:hypothetical protein